MECSLFKDPFGLPKSSNIDNCSRFKTSSFQWDLIVEVKGNTQVKGQAFLQRIMGCPEIFLWSKSMYRRENLSSEWLRNSLVTGSRTFHNDDEGHRIFMVITLIMVEDSKKWSGWHGDNLITCNTSTVNTLLCLTVSYGDPYVTWSSRIDRKSVMTCYWFQKFYFI